MIFKTINYHGLELFSPMYDIIFKGILLGDNDYTLLADLLSHALKMDIKADGIQVNNAELPVKNESDKAIRLDLIVTLADKSIVNIEIQTGNERNMAKRSVVNLCKLMVGQVKSGGKYKDVCPVIAINILDFDFLKGSDSYHNRYRLKNLDTGAEMPDADVFEIHFVELPKRPQNTVGDKFVTWLNFLSAKTEEDLEMVKTQSPKIFGIAVDKLVKLSADEELRVRLYKAEKYEMDRLSELDSKWEDGMEKGIEKGKCDVARSMLSDGESIDKIIKYTGLTVDDIIQIQNAMPHK